MLYLFLVGVELDPEVLQRNGRKAITIAAVGIALPFGLGCLISPLLFHKLLIPEPGYENAHYGSFLVFVRFVLSCLIPSLSCSLEMMDNNDTPTTY